MRILFDICHPAHVHVFSNPIRILADRGHEILLTSRDKDMSLALLEQLKLPHRTLSAQTAPGPAALARELFVRDTRLVRVVREFRPDVMAAVGGIFIAHAGLFTRTPSLVFYDTENAVLQNLLTYPLATRVIVPRCYRGWTPARRTIRYAGYHELSYLHPARFEPDLDTALRNGVAADGRTFLVRVVSWQANHDIGERGWNAELLLRVVSRLAAAGRVLLSAEGRVPSALDQYVYRGRAADMHHVLAFCSGFVGESATMASEGAILGVPSVYAANTGRGYTDEQESRYGLVRNVRELQWPELERAIDWVLSQEPPALRSARARLLDDTIDVAAFAARCIETRGASGEAG